MLILVFTLLLFKSMKYTKFRNILTILIASSCISFSASFANDITNAADADRFNNVPDHQVMQESLISNVPHEGNLHFVDKVEDYTSEKGQTVSYAEGHADRVKDALKKVLGEFKRGIKDKSEAIKKQLDTHLVDAYSDASSAQVKDIKKGVEKQKKKIDSDLEEYVKTEESVIKDQEKHISDMKDSFKKEISKFDKDADKIAKTKEFNKKLEEKYMQVRSDSESHVIHYDTLMAKDTAKFIDDHVAKLLKAGVKPKKPLGEKIKDKASEIKGEVAEMKDKVGEKMHNAADATKDAMKKAGEKVSNAAHKVGDKAVEVKDDVKDAMIDAKNKAADKIEDMRDSSKVAKEKAEAKAQDLKDKTKKIKKETEEKIEELKEKEKAKLEEIKK